MSKIYTRTGDKGTTSLLGGTRLPKSHPRFHAYGTIDELNAHLGILASQLIGSDNTDSSGRPDSSNNPSNPNNDSIKSIVLRIQNELFIAGSLLACDEVAWLAKLPRLSDAHIAALEGEIDLWTGELPALKNFILPGGTAAALTAHVARTVCRRAERWTLDVLPEAGEDFQIEYQRIGTYLNRLSDHLFTLGRYLNHRAHCPETPWIPS